MTHLNALFYPKVRFGDRLSTAKPEALEAGSSSTHPRGRRHPPRQAKPQQWRQPALPPQATQQRHRVAPGRILWDYFICSQSPQTSQFPDIDTGVPTKAIPGGTPWDHPHEGEGTLQCAWGTLGIDGSPKVRKNPHVFSANGVQRILIRGPTVRIGTAEIQTARRQVLFTEGAQVHQQEAGTDIMGLIVREPMCFMPTMLGGRHGWECRQVMGMAKHPES